MSLVVSSSIIDALRHFVFFCRVLWGCCSSRCIWPCCVYCICISALLYLRINYQQGSGECRHCWFTFGKYVSAVVCDGGRSELPLRLCWTFITALRSIRGSLDHTSWRRCSCSWELRSLTLTDYSLTTVVHFFVYDRAVHYEAIKYNRHSSVQSQFSFWLQHLVTWSLPAFGSCSGSFSGMVACVSPREITSCRSYQLMHIAWRPFTACLLVDEHRRTDGPIAIINIIIIIISRVLQSL